MIEELPDKTLETRRKLLNAAGEVFAEKGFASATVRDICTRAGANIAAVNYHFGDKTRLYSAVFEDSRCTANEQFAVGDLASLSPEERLRAFVRQFLRRLLDPGRPSWHGKLMAREMSEPTGVLNAFIEDDIRPRVAMVQEIIIELVGELPPRVVAKCAVSVVGQMLHYHFARPVLKRVSPIYASLDQNIEELVDHVTRFSIGGIRAIADRYRKGGEAGNGSV